MKFILTAGWDDGIADLTERLVRELASGKNVLWLMSGGSNIPATVQIMESIPDKLATNLTVMLADERYGSVGHTDSNWAQLKDAGLNTGKATAVVILQDGLNQDATTKRYEELVRESINNTDITIAQLGVGPDGHIAGILLNSPALSAKGHYVKTFTSQETPPLKRMTLTFEGLSHVDAAYCFAFGKPKRVALKRLQKDDISRTEQPAQILQDLPEAYIYNDQVGHHA